LTRLIRSLALMTVIKNLGRHTAEETAPGAGAGAPAAKQPTREAARAMEAPARVVETAGGAAMATPAAATTSAEPPRKRKRGFSTLRLAITSP
jgi:hypothetical protein